MAIAEFSVAPSGKSTGMSVYVARCLDLVDRSGLPYRLGPMGTVVEGPLDEILALVAACHKAVARDCDRVSTYLKIDDRKGAKGQIDAKVAAVEKALGRKLRT